MATCQKSLGVAGTTAALQSILQGTIYVPAFLSDVATAGQAPDVASDRAAGSATASNRRYPDAAPARCFGAAYDRHVQQGAGARPQARRRDGENPRGRPFSQSRCEKSRRSSGCRRANVSGSRQNVKQPRQTISRDGALPPSTRPIGSSECQIGRRWTRNCILVAEDLEANQELVRIYLRAGGYRAAFVANGAEAVKAVRSKIYDLVLMDVQMPQMDGIAAAKAIRKLDGSVRNIPIIAMTANVLPKQIRCIEAAGMNGYVAKPTELDDLLTEIGRLVVQPSKVLAHLRAPAEREPLVAEVILWSFAQSAARKWSPRGLRAFRKNFELHSSIKNRI